MTSLVNVSLKFQTLISEFASIFVEKMTEAFALQFFQQKFQCIRLQSRKTLNELTSERAR